MFSVVLIHLTEKTMMIPVLSHLTSMLDDYLLRSGEISTNRLRKFDTILL